MLVLYVVLAIANGGCSNTAIGALTAGPEVHSTRRVGKVSRVPQMSDSRVASSRQHAAGVLADYLAHNGVPDEVRTRLIAYMTILTPHAGDPSQG